MPQKNLVQVLELKIPPLVIMLVIAALMWLASRATPTLKFPIPGRTFLGACFAIAGVVIGALGVVSFRRARTTINPMNPAATSTMVINGIYSLTRNPMYLGILAVLLGWAFIMANSVAFLFLPAFILYMNKFQIKPEERALVCRFGQEFLTYQSRVRRWL